jgi:hypothetical protein
MIVAPLLMGSSSAMPNTVLMKSVKICFTTLFKQIKQFFQGSHRIGLVMT